jgi:hypothetical protein
MKEIKCLIPGRRGINVQTSSIHFLRDSVSILPHCRSNHRTVTLNDASVHDLTDYSIKICRQEKRTYDGRCRFGVSLINKYDFSFIIRSI